MEPRSQADLLSAETAMSDRGGSSQRDFPQVRWLAPRAVSLGAGHLMWAVDRADKRTTRMVNASPSKDPFDAFLRLALAKDEDIRNFAFRWGVLGLCVHGDRPAVCLRCERYVQYGLGLLPEGSESVDAWRWWSSLALELLTAVIEPRGSWVRLEELLERNELGAELVRIGFVRRGARGRETAVWLINHFWMARSAVGLRLQSVEPIPRLIFGGTEWDGLFPHLAFQLAARAARADHFFICAACQWPSTRSRRPKSGQPNYCTKSECRAQRGRNNEFNRTTRRKAQ